MGLTKLTLLFTLWAALDLLVMSGVRAITYDITDLQEDKTINVRLGSEIRLNCAKPCEHEDDRIYWHQESDIMSAYFEFKDKENVCVLKFTQNHAVSLKSRVCKNNMYTVIFSSIQFRHGGMWLCGVARSHRHSDTWSSKRLHIKVFNPNPEEIANQQHSVRWRALTAYTLSGLGAGMLLLAVIILVCFHLARRRETNRGASSSDVGPENSYDSIQSQDMNSGDYNSVQGVVSGAMSAADGGSHPLRQTQGMGHTSTHRSTGGATQQAPRPGYSAPHANLQEYSHAYGVIGGTTYNI